MIAEKVHWADIEVGNYIVSHPSGEIWRVDAIQVDADARPCKMRLVNRDQQTVDIEPDEWDSLNMEFAVVTRMVPTPEEALAVVRGVFPDAKEI